MHCDHKHQELSTQPHPHPLTSPPVACQLQKPSYLDTLNIASTQIDVNRLREGLLTNTNTVAAYKLIQGFSPGFKLCYKGPRISKLVIISNPRMVLHSKQ